ncbi:hypothetical protein KQX54_017357 [Cotesia glomerata]|uniref:Uncharacterized protein n=1 Tax=Cotesia glomerata TaxID=32391 RepID=A0AAV7IWF7_COTGL|nr:hypothetical protein KQX54_017357 [Cotesia glomerata]
MLEYKMSMKECADIRLRTITVPQNTTVHLKSSLLEVIKSINPKRMLTSNKTEANKALRCVIGPLAVAFIEPRNTLAARKRTELSGCGHCTLKDCFFRKLDKCCGNVNINDDQDTTENEGKVKAVACRETGKGLFPSRTVARGLGSLKLTGRLLHNPAHTVDIGYGTETSTSTEVALAGEFI